MLKLNIKVTENTDEIMKMGTIIYKEQQFVKFYWKTSVWCVSVTTDTYLVILSSPSP